MKSWGGGVVQWERPLRFGIPIGVCISLWLRLYMGTPNPTQKASHFTLMPRIQWDIKVNLPKWNPSLLVYWNNCSPWLLVTPGTLHPMRSLAKYWLPPSLGALHPARPFELHTPTLKWACNYKLSQSLGLTSHECHHILKFEVYTMSWAYLGPIYTWH